MSVRVRVQMVGTQRSGSNLLRLMLAQLPGVFAPPSAHILRDFELLLAQYRPLAQKGNLTRLALDIGRVIDANVLRWPNGPPTADAVVAACQGRTLEHVFCAVYDAAALEAGAAGWVCKSLENVHRIPALRRLPEFGFIHLLRDPRDVALSFAAAPIGPKVPEVAAQRWADDQKAAVRYRDQVNPAMWVEVRYEDLVKEPEATMRNLCELFNVPYTDQVLTFYTRSEASHARALSTLWTNLSSPIQEASVGRYHQPSTAQFVRRVEDVAYDQMRSFGYAPLYANAERNPNDEEWAKLVVTDSALRRAALAQADPQVEAVHRRRAEVLSALGLSGMLSRVAEHG